MFESSSPASSMAILIAAVIAGQDAIACDCARAATKVDPAVETELSSVNTARVIIKTRPDPTVPGGGMAASAPATYLAGSLGMSTAQIATVAANLAVAKLDSTSLERARRDPNVEAIYADIPVPPAVFESIPLVGADKVQQRGFQGNEYSVAVLDTGVDRTHPALAGAVATEVCFSTPDSNGAHPSRSLCPGGFDVSLIAGAAAPCSADVDGCYHGTHVAGIIAGHGLQYKEKTYNGMAPGSKIVAIQVFSLFTSDVDCHGLPLPCILSYPSDQLKAMNWILRNHEQYKIAAVNMSLGSGFYEDFCDNESALTEPIERLREKGVITVVAAGNEKLYAAVAMPGCISSALTVSAITKGGEIDASYANISPAVDIVAPGTQVLSTLPGGGYGFLSGTSMAAPHVAGAIALLRQEYPTASAAELQQRLINGAAMVMDRRTGAMFPQLEVSHTLPLIAQPPGQKGAAPASVASASRVAAPVAVPSSTAAVAAAPAAIVAAAAPSAGPAAPRPARASSFILRTTSSAAAVMSSVQSMCPANNCSIKQLGSDTWRFDISPTLGGRAGMTAEDVRQALGLAPDTKVYANTPAAPLSAP